MKKHSLESKIDQVKSLFKEQEVNRLAKESKLIQRSTGKLNPMVFLIVMIVEMSLLGTHSLRAMCELFTQYGGMSMTPQALSSRLNGAAAVSFFKKALSLILNSKLSNAINDVQQKGILSRFRNVYLEDSTTCTLHEHVADAFKGSGGDGCKAGYKVHTVWNAIKRCLEHFYVTPSSTTDQSQSFEILKHLKQGDLILRDLGYFSLPCFKKIHELGAYFLSRLKAGIKVYTSEGFLIGDIVKFIEGIAKLGMLGTFS